MGRRRRKSIRRLLVALAVLAAGRGEAGTVHELIRGDARIPDGVFDWSGAYVGVNIGLATPQRPGTPLEARWPLSASIYDLYPGSWEHAGLTGGGQAGYLWQAGRVVYGMEMDFNYLGGQTGPAALAAASPVYWAAGAPLYGVQYHPTAPLFGTMRGRLGVAIDRWLLYTTLGLTTGGTRGAASVFFLPDTSQWFTAQQSGSKLTKFVAGAGLEYALTDSTSARFEYFFLDQNRSKQIFLGFAPPHHFVSNVMNQSNVFRVGVNHLFGDENRYHPAGNPKATEELYSFHILETNVLQGYPSFPAKYTGTNSFPSRGELRDGSTTDFFAGIRLWDGAAVYVNPETNSGYAVGQGDGNVVGAASFPNASFTRGTSGSPYLRFMRYFLRQTIGLGGGDDSSAPTDGAHSVQLEAAAGQIARLVDRNRITLQIGKYAVNDIFGTNAYASDPTRDFLNFNFSNALGSFDYASDVWGYTYGATAQWRQDWWTARAGVFQLPLTPGSPQIEPVLCRQCMFVGELEARYDLLGQPGAIKFLAYDDMGYMADLVQINALAFLTGSYPPQTSWLRNKHTKTGFGINIAQQLAPNIGFFLRAGANSGNFETISYTDMDSGVAGGLVFSGALWGLKKDEIGVGLSTASLRTARASYLALGGLGLMVGDGALTYGNERVVETFYRHQFFDWLEGSLDYQFLGNPGYNQARGPINFFGFRLRAAI
jgi:high affinity Mn2+ porin